MNRDCILRLALVCGMSALFFVTPVLAEPEAPTAQAIIDTLEAAHAAEVFAAQDGIEAFFNIDFGNGPNIRGTMLFTPSLDRVRMTFMDSEAVIVYDGHHVWLSPPDAEVPGPPARFHVFTWPYFMAAPYKLDDPGTRHEATGLRPVRRGEFLHGIKVMFDPGVGDTPEDWYMAFPDPDSGRLSALAYIVTYGQSVEKAEQNPGVLLYMDYNLVEGVPFAHIWLFKHWKTPEGVGETTKGIAMLGNIRFVTPAADAFVKPEDAVEAEAPGE